MIDQRRGGAGGEGHFYERKAALLSKEDQIESEFEEMVTALSETWQLLVPAHSLIAGQSSHQTTNLYCCFEHQIF